MMQLAHRRWVGRLIRVGLVAVAIILVARWLSQRTSGATDVRIQSDAPAVSELAPGDARIFSRDSAVNLVLQGDRILAGLSPKTVESIRAGIASAGTNDTSGLGGAIAQFVKKTVADNIDTHVVYHLAEIRDIAYEDEEIVIHDLSGGRTRLFNGVKVNKDQVSKSFSREDALRFIELVKARKRQVP